MACNKRKKTEQGLEPLLPPDLPSVECLLGNITAWRDFNMRLTSLLGQHDRAETHRKGVEKISALFNTHVKPVFPGKVFDEGHVRNLDNGCYAYSFHGVHIDFNIRAHGERVVEDCTVTVGDDVLLRYRNKRV